MKKILRDKVLMARRRGIEAERRRDQYRRRTFAENRKKLAKLDPAIFNLADEVEISSYGRLSVTVRGSSFAACLPALELIEQAYGEDVSITDYPEYSNRDYNYNGAGLQFYLIEDGDNAACRVEKVTIKVDQVQAKFVCRNGEEL